MLQVVRVLFSYNARASLSKAGTIAREKGHEKIAEICTERARPKALVRQATQKLAQAAP